MTFVEGLFIVLILAGVVLLFCTALRRYANDNTPGEDVGLGILDEDTEADYT